LVADLGGAYGVQCPHLIFKLHNLCDIFHII
jgi:hypothetical protein